jgi:hypothetical protein
MPLLRAMHAEAKGRSDVPRGSLVCMPASGQLSVKLKVYLRRVGIERADLFTSDETRKAITHHDLRATGITWCAVRGDDALKIKQRAGHASFSTTEGYIREAENMRRRLRRRLPGGACRPARSRPGATDAEPTAGGFGFRRRWLYETPKNKPDQVGEAGFETGPNVRARSRGSS